MPCYIALGCLEVGEKFLVVVVLNQLLCYPNFRLGWAVTKISFI